MCVVMMYWMVLFDRHTSDCSNKSRDVNPSGQEKVMNDFPSQSITEEAAHKPLPKKATSSTVIWKQARQHLVSVCVCS